ncbi:hypothetical protein D3C71_756000 [compost metagenome]
MGRKRTVLLEFNSQIDSLEKKKLRDGLSTVLQIGSSLWLANDEMLSLERLTYQGLSAADEFVFADHQRFVLNDLLNLPAPPTSSQKFEEADIEGLAYDEAEGYLWLIGSHSLKRKQADEKKSAAENIERLGKVSSDGNRYLLARIPVVEQNGTFSLLRETPDSQRTAARLHGQQSWNELTDALKDDDHLRDFFAIPGKDNGFDIEGLAVCGTRLFIGLRGPVLRGWAIILEVEPVVDGDDSRSLKLGKIGEGGRRYLKHFIQLGGLGIRDLCVQGRDLLILAGPTMDLDGPVTVSRWPNGVHTTGDSVVFSEALETVRDIPFGRGSDHAEGLSLFSIADLPGPSILVVYDAPDDHRKGEDGRVQADVFEL